MVEKLAGQSTSSADAGAHPEEMRGSINLQIGSNITMRAAGRTTPAGVITAGIAAAAVLLALAALLRASNHRSISE